MPNYCNYTISVGGRTENVNKFIEILNHDYDQVHMYRIFEAHPYFQNQYGMYSHANISGDCAWSVATCMLKGAFSYYDQDLKRCMNNETARYWIDGRGTVSEICTLYNFNGTHLQELAKTLNLTIQVFSTEPSMQFLEDIKILPDGTMVRNYCGEYEEWWIADYNTYQDMLDDYNLKSNNCPFDEAEFDELKSNHADYWSYSEIEYNDEIPDEPKYLAKNIMYKLRKDK